MRAIVNPLLRLGPFRSSSCLTQPARHRKPSLVVSRLPLTKSSSSTTTTTTTTTSSSPASHPTDATSEVVRGMLSGAVVSSPSQSSPPMPSPLSPPSSISSSTSLNDPIVPDGAMTSSSSSSSSTGKTTGSSRGTRPFDKHAEPLHQLSVYSTRHNTHITLARPNRDVVFALTAGNLGFRKAARGSYDAAYQLATYALRRIHDDALLDNAARVALVFRGFGTGKTAVVKALMGSEGRAVRDRVVRVAEKTRLKFGGARSPAPRRLG